MFTEISKKKNNPKWKIYSQFKLSLGNKIKKRVEYSLPERPSKNNANA